MNDNFILILILNLIHKLIIKLNTFELTEKIVLIRVSQLIYHIS
jgi:hypothetical protein